jgi:hypothetical protein
MTSPTYARHQLLKTSRKRFRKCCFLPAWWKLPRMLGGSKYTIDASRPLSGYESIGLGPSQIIASFWSATFSAMWSRYTMVDLSKRLGLLAHFAPASNVSITGGPEMEPSCQDGGVAVGIRRSPPLGVFCHGLPARSFACKQPSSVCYVNHRFSVSYDRVHSFFISFIAVASMQHAATRSFPRFL